MTSRIFGINDIPVSAEGAAVKTVVTQSPDASVFLWHVPPGEAVPPHIHPSGQDSWIILEGEGEYLAEAGEHPVTVRAGEVVVAHRGEAHGVTNTGSGPFRFLSVLSPSDAGYELLP